MVDAFDSYPGAQLRAAGANDIEAGLLPADKDSSDVRSWVQAFDDYNGFISYYNYGSADGCPQSSIPQSNDCGAAGHPNVDANDIWYWSWGASPAFPLPEIYTRSGSQANQWKYLSLFGVVRKGGSRMDFVAPMTQSGACASQSCAGTDNTPEQGWMQLDSALDSDSRVRDATLLLTDIRFAD